MRETQKNLSDAERALNEAEEELANAKRGNKAAKEMRVEGAEEKDLLRKVREEADERLRKAKRDERAARKALNAARDEASLVANAQSEITRLEQEILELDRKLNEVASDPALAQQYGSGKGARPPSVSEQAKEYRRLEKKRATKVDELEGRTGDLTQTIAEQVRRMTPGEEGKTRALQNAENFSQLEGGKYKMLAPVDGQPIDVTTGQPIKANQTWESDHIMPRTEIAKDPRFAALDRAGREIMINGIPENELPLEYIVNRSKQDTPMNKWLMSRGKGGKAIDPKIAEALRAADKRARDAVEAMFEKLLGPQE